MSKPVQPDLFAPDPPYVRGSETSEAAAYLTRANAAALRTRVLEHLQRSGPATDEQLQNALGLPGSTERPRRVELVAMGLVVDTGNKARTCSGRWAVLWGVR